MFGRKGARAREGAAVSIAALALAFAVGGCTRESVRIALETQRRADQVQQSIFDQQHESLRILLYRNMLARLGGARPSPSADQRAVLSDVWNERDRIEFWRVQYERSRALRMMGVDAKLFADQSIIDLLYKSLTAKFDRGKQALAARAGKAMTDDAVEPTSSP